MAEGSTPASGGEIRAARIAWGVWGRVAGSAAILSGGAVGLTAAAGGAGEPFPRFVALVAVLLGATATLGAAVLVRWDLYPLLRRLAWAAGGDPSRWAAQAAAAGPVLGRYPTRLARQTGLTLLLAMGPLLVAATLVVPLPRDLAACTAGPALLAILVLGRTARVAARRALRPLHAALPAPAPGASPGADLAARVSDLLVLPVGVAALVGLLLFRAGGPGRNPEDRARAAAAREAVALLAAAGLPRDLAARDFTARRVDCGTPQDPAARAACRLGAASRPVEGILPSGHTGFAAAPAGDRIVLVEWPLAGLRLTPGWFYGAVALLLLLAHLVGALIGSRLGHRLAAVERRLDDPAGDHPPGTTSVKELREVQAAAGELADRVLAAERNEQAAIDDQQEAHRVRSRFLASVSHDIKGPLNAILGFSELLLRGVEGPLSGRQREGVRLIHASGENLLAIINAILDAAKLEAGRIELNREWVAPVTLVSRAAAQADAIAAGRDLQVVADVQAGLPPVHVDPHRIGQALDQLVSNAVKFTPQGEVHLRALRDTVDDRPHLRIDVVDQGPGIDPSQRERIFTAFEQIDAGSARRAGGTGLGLFLARAMVELHGGSLRVDSRLGEGSTFSLLLPLEPPQTGS